MALEPKRSNFDLKQAQRACRTFFFNCPVASVSLVLLTRYVLYGRILFIHDFIEFFA